MCPPAPQPGAGALNPDAGLLPAGFGIRLDAATRCSADGRTLIGGTPMRQLRLSEHAAKLLANLRDGAPAVSPAARRLGRHLCDAGIAHPAPPAEGPDPGEVTCVVPVRDDPEGLAALLASLDSSSPRPGRLVVAEDGSRHPDAVVELGRHADSHLISHPEARGPAAARNEGWRAAGTPVVAFLDADVEVGPGWLPPLLAHFADPTVAAVAPRVRAPAGEGRTLDRFERHCSPLDMGPLPSSVGPRRRVRYVPSAALLFRRDVLEALGGFDEDLRVGEDVDLVWRAAAAGWTVRYEPSVVVHHRNRSTWAALARQRYGYGTSAAALAERHPDGAVPLEIAPWSLAAWLALVLGGPRGAWTATSITARRVRKLHESLVGRGEASLGSSAHLVLRSHVASGVRAATAVRRTWLPLLPAVATWTWGRRLAIAALVAEPLVAWATRRPSLGSVRWILATLLSDAAYCAGVWRGAVAARSAAALRPRLTAATAKPATAQIGARDSGPRPPPG